MCTRFASLRPVKNKTAKAVAEILLAIVQDFGVPKILQSDNGLEFVNENAKQLCKQLGIDKRTSAPYHPACNGAVERLNQTVVGNLKKMMSGETHL